jgi:formylglycine-generating enzyme
VETLTADGELACDACRRVLSAASADDFPVSFSVVPNGEPLLLRTRLYRSKVVNEDGLPRTTFLIDNLGVLPKVSSRVNVSARLSLRCFGKPASLATGLSCAPDSGELVPIAELPLAGEPLIVGSSPSIAPRDCATEPPPGMHCLPGGLFILGDAAALQLTGTSISVPEHLVRLSPFFLDEDEMTVGIVRRLIREDVVSRVPSRPDPRWPGCTYLGEDDDSHDDAPINCVPRVLADEVCAALGKRLPTEAEWEYAAGNATRESQFPWGEDHDVCRYAVVARTSLQRRLDTRKGDDSCIAALGAPALFAPQSGGSPDDLSDQGLKNLGGNLTEIVADAFASYTSACWSSEDVLSDPRCDEADDARFAYSLRGGSWSELPLYAPAAVRNGRGDGVLIDDTVGFRCAQDAE